MVCVDLVGPFTIRTPSKSHPLFALTMIDPATGWFEIVEAKNNLTKSIQELFHDIWLARYPRPQFIVFDNGGKFKLEFKQMCVQDNYGIKAKPTTSHNPQATTHKQMSDNYGIKAKQTTSHNPQGYAIIEQLHKVAYCQ
jgi:hypothetical protein